MSNLSYFYFAFHLLVHVRAALFRDSCRDIFAGFASGTFGFRHDVHLGLELDSKYDIRTPLLLLLSLFCMVLIHNRPRAIS